MWLGAMYKMVVPYLTAEEPVVVHLHQLVHLHLLAQKSLHRPLGTVCIRKAC